MITRAQWQARPPKNRAGRLTAPRGVTYHWGGPPVGIRTHADCPRKVRAWQTFHMDERGWADLAYNLVVCPHGDVYEGRGAGVRSAANGTNVGNASHYAICYLGGEGEPLTDAGKRGLLDARDYLIAHGNAGREVRTHSSWKDTGCPGPVLEQWVADGCPCDEPTPPAPLVIPEDDVHKLIETTDTRKLYALSSVGLAHIPSMDAAWAMVRLGAFGDPGKFPTSTKVTQADVDLTNGVLG